MIIKGSLIRLNLIFIFELYKIKKQTG